MRGAAGILRHYLEYFSAEVCHRLRAPVEFRGDHQFQLGDLLPSAIGQYGKLLKEAKNAAQSWGQKDKIEAITQREEAFKKAVADSKVEQWQMNTAIHYNAWENFQKQDFVPVVAAFRTLVAQFACAMETCGALFYVLPDRGEREAVRCACGSSDLNLKSKK